MRSWRFNDSIPSARGATRWRRGTCRFRVLRSNGIIAPADLPPAVWVEGPNCLCDEFGACDRLEPNFDIFGGKIHVCVQEPDAHGLVTSLGEDAALVPITRGECK